MLESRRERRLSADAAKLGGGREKVDLAGLKIGLLSSHTEVAKAAETMLRRRYTWAMEEEAETLVALGGDGFPELGSRITIGIGRVTCSR